MTPREAAPSWTLLRGDGPVRTALYLHSDADELAAVWSLVPHDGLALVGVSGADWDADLSPWPAPRAFRGGADFAGRAEEHLATLVGRVVPAAEAELGGAPARRGLAGYSLAGLFAVYALYRTDCFSLIGSMSGSLWFDGFADWMAARAPRVPSARVYLSLGDAEAHARSPRLASVADCTARAEALLRAGGADCSFRWERGNHFADVTGRLARGIAWLANEG